MKTINNFLIDFIKNVSNINISILGISLDFSPEDLFDKPSIDERLNRLNSLKKDLQYSMALVDDLEKETILKKRNVDELNKTIQSLIKEKSTTEYLLKIPEEDFARVLSKATSKGRWRGIIEGLFLGLFTGAVTSYAVWFFTNH